MIVIFIFGCFLRNRANGRHKVKVPLKKNKEKEGKAISHYPGEHVVYIYSYISTYV